VELLQAELDLLPGPNRLGVEQVLESATDGLRFELAALVDARAPFTFPADQDTAFTNLRKRANLSVFYQVLEEEWRECLYEDLRVSITPAGRILLKPNDAQRAENQAVGMHRKAAVSLELLVHSVALLRQQPRNALKGHLGIRQSGSGKDKRYIVAELSDGDAVELLAARMGAAEPDLEPFALEPLPNFAGLTVSELLDVWSSLMPLADDLVNGLRIPQATRSVQAIEQMAPVLKTKDLRKPIQKCTGLSSEKCVVALEAMTWRNRHDSLWHRPLVRLDSSRVVPVLPALISPNLQRSVEYWLKEGGIDLGARGGRYERHVRKEMCDAVKNNSVLDDAGAVPTEITPPDLAVGNIDLLFWIGGTIVVTEIKCLLRPATAYDWFLYENRVREAVSQAHRKADYVRANPGWLDESIHLHGKIRSGQRTVLPCVLLNSPVGALRTVSNVPIVDLLILSRYLGEGFGLLNSVSDDRSSGTRIQFYSTCCEAEERLAAFLKEPEHLQMYRQSVQWDVVYQPSFHLQPEWISRLFPKIVIPSPLSSAPG